MSDTESEKKKFELHPEIKDTLIRAVYLILFYIIGYLAGCLVFFISIFQFFYQLIFKSANARIANFSKGLNRYFYEILQYVTFNSDYKPFPFAPWPKTSSGSEES